MRSISMKITTLTITAIMVSILAIGGLGINAIRVQGYEAAEREMSLLCENSQRTIDQYLSSVEQSVDMISHYAVDKLDVTPLVEGGVTGSDGLGARMKDRDWDSPQQQALDAYLKEYAATVQDVFGSLANHTSSVISYYFRFNQELSNSVPSQGFLYSRIGTQSFVQVQVTDVSAFDPSDDEHVAWYYTPLRTGRPTWMNPYLNDNLGGVEVLSYVVPVYKAGTFIGVIGMDISYDTLVEQLDGRHIYETGFVCLLDANGTVIYNPFAPPGSDLSCLGPDVMEHAQTILEQDHSDSLVHYTVNGEKRTLTYTTLSNGLKLIVTVPDAELNRSWHRLINGVTVTALGILVCFLALTLITMRQITEPLKRLTAASRKISAGQYDISLDYKGGDEVAMLTAAFQQLVSNLKVYIADLNSKAYSDALTGVKNKGAFDIFAHKLNDQICAAEADEQPRFAVVMMDCNHLKQINDAFGHAKGDIYLRTACTLICQVFKHSPVFRLGGDEFVALLAGEDYESREELVRFFCRRSEEISSATEHPWERISVAVGMAVYSPKSDPTVEAVFRRADQIMYNNKRIMKAQMLASGGSDNAF